jgi:hypothetical protein
MRIIAIAALLALTLLSTAALPTLGQTEGLKPPALYAGADFSMTCGSITQNGWVVWCDGDRSEFRMWDVKNPTRVTRIKAHTVRYDLSTGEVRPEINVSIVIENVPNSQTLSNRTLVLPVPANR